MYYSLLECNEWKPIYKHEISIFINKKHSPLALSVVGFGIKNDQVKLEK